MSDPHLSISLTNEQPFPVDEDRIRATARRTAEAESARGEISITLVDEVRMAQLNEKWMGSTGPTDVLSFPIDDGEPEDPDGPPRMIGEVVICPAVAGAQAAGDEASELDLLVAHGVLHLLGFDHEDADGAEQMRAREQAASGRMGATSA